MIKLFGSDQKGTIKMNNFFLLMSNTDKNMTNVNEMDKKTKNNQYSTLFDTI